MYSVNALAYPVSPTTPQASVASMIASAEPVVGRLPVNRVSGVVSYGGIRNDRHGNTPEPAAPAQTVAASATPAGTAAEEPSPATLGRITSFPVLFLAQLLGQGDAAGQQLATAYETLLAYGDVKYKPSNAGKPQNPGRVEAFFTGLQESAGPANTNQAAPAPANLNPPPAAIVPAPGAKGGIPGFIRVSGAAAYSLAAMRNTLFLEKDGEEHAAVA